MIVVADSTPLIALSRIGRLELLQRLYRSILIPPQVYDEVVEQGDGRSGASEVADAGWIIPTNFTDVIEFQRLRRTLGAGEAGGIVLAGELAANLLLVDEIKARREAKLHGLVVMGTIGVLQQAKLHGLISALAQGLANLRANGFHLSEKTLVTALRLSGED